MRNVFDVYRKMPGFPSIMHEWSNLGSRVSTPMPLDGSFRLGLVQYAVARVSSFCLRSAGSLQRHRQTTGKCKHISAKMIVHSVADLTVKSLLTFFNRHLALFSEK